MTKKQKRIQKLFANPKNVSFATLDTVLKSCGFICRQPKSGSSHYVYTRNTQSITVPFKRPFVKEIYIKQVLELIGED